MESSKRTLNVTLQRSKQDENLSLSRNMRTNDGMLRYKLMHTQFFTDKFFAPKTAKSWRVNACMQIFVSDKGFVFVAPIK